MKLFIPFVILFISVLQANDPSLDKIWENFVAKKRNAHILELANATHDGFLVEIPPTDERLVAIDAALTSYEAETLEKSILLFVKEELGLNTSKFTIESYHRNITSPERTLIFFIFDSSKKLVTVIKAFHERMNFVKGFSSLRKLYLLNLNFSTTIAPLGIGKTRNYDKPLYLLAESIASGKTIQDLIWDIKGTRGEERKKKFLIAKNAVTRLAQAIAELHFKPFEKTGVKPFHSEGLASLVPIYDVLRRENVEKNGIHIDFELIDNFLKDLDKCIILYLPEKVYAHGDLNWVNVFYNASTNQLTFIDLITFHRCVDKRGHPAAPYHQALRDYYFGYRKLDHTNRAVLNKSELKLMEESYRETYTKGAAVSDHPEMVQLYWKTLGLLGAFAQHFHSFKYAESMDVKVGKLKETYKEILDTREEFYRLRKE